MYCFSLVSCELFHKAIRHVNVLHFLFKLYLTRIFCLYRYTQMNRTVHFVTAVYVHNVFLSPPCLTFHFHHFYSAIFCHFGHREGISNAVAPLCSPLPCRASGLACEAGPEEGGAEGSRWALIHYWSFPIENLMEILPPTLLLFSGPLVPCRLSLPFSYFSLMSPLCSYPLV